MGGDEQWWADGAPAPSDEAPSEQPPKPSEEEQPSDPSTPPTPGTETGTDKGSSRNFGAGVATGMGILGAVVAALMALAQQASCVTINPCSCVVAMVSG